MERFLAVATVSAEQCAASYMYDFKTDSVSKTELRNWGKHLNKYFEDNGLPFYAYCDACDIKNMGIAKMSMFAANDQYVTLKDNVSLEMIYERVLSELNGLVLPHVIRAKHSYYHIENE